ncbi:hypothetical protein SUGI_0264380 [Cryptomeria japonica]|nr:hypothetical protein SUGI_0264380 [Cryptomeria japonica]
MWSSKGCRKVLNMFDTGHSLTEAPLSVGFISSTGLQAILVQYVAMFWSPICERNYAANPGNPGTLFYLAFLEFPWTFQFLSLPKSSI